MILIMVDHQTFDDDHCCQIRQCWISIIRYGNDDQIWSVLIMMIRYDQCWSAIIMLSALIRRRTAHDSADPMTLYIQSELINTWSGVVVKIGQNHCKNQRRIIGDLWFRCDQCWSLKKISINTLFMYVIYADSMMTWKIFSKIRSDQYWLRISRFPISAVRAAELDSWSELIS